MFDATPSARVLVLAGIIGLHGVLGIFLTVFHSAPIGQPEVARVLMTQLLAEQEVPKPLPKPIPSVARPVAKPAVRAVAKPVTKPVAGPISAPVPRHSADLPPVIAPQSAPSASPPIAMAAPAPLSVASEPSPPVQAVAITPPRFNVAYLDNPPPAYPVMARRLGEEGKVILRVFVTPEGTAGEVRVQSSSGSLLFDEAAIAAVSQWRFVPARRGDTAIGASVQVPIVFRLT